MLIRGSLVWGDDITSSLGLYSPPPSASLVSAASASCRPSPGRLGELNGKPEGRMTTGLLGHRDISQILFKANRIPRSATPPQLDGSEVVDDAGSMDYRFEETRLASFEGWPSAHVRPEALAAAGFYYTKSIDRVRCFECSTEICRWEEGDDPMVEHQRWGGRCRFIRRLPCGNVPIGADATAIPQPRTRSLDVCGPYRLDYRLGAEADTHAEPPTCTSGNGSGAQQHLPSAARLGSLGLGIAKRPDFPDHATYEARLQTFAEWPTSIAQTKEALADAGFFYTGTGDQTTCYHCGGGLKNWEPQDDPWMQHAKWFSGCLYVRLVKGQEFINSVTGKQLPPLSEEETMKMNLPGYIKKVETPVPQKRESKSEPTTQPSASTVTTQSAGPSNSSEGPSPMPRTIIPVESSATTQSMMENGCPKGEAQVETLPQQQQQQQPNEKKTIDDARVCKICYNEELGVVFLPCGHMVACVKCAPGMTTCALCREPVAMTVRVFFS
ncbi:hypothetical protein QAD02_014419 [Eretmocerus hayati]|uniref:Uncharacterized protein n=1 Tax=Eretmocerus hayati TaxID=131215 RepID=A0ACC2P5H4_9HYME|nr:hypothetical protein QAD02_014419 [Eretmocerus hayati]